MWHYSKKQDISNENTVETDYNPFAKMASGIVPISIGKIGMD